MTKATGRRDRPSAGTIVVALLSGLLVFLALLPSGGVDTQPPECYSYLFYSVPCEGWVAPLAGAVTALLLGFASWRYGPDSSSHRA